MTNEIVSEQELGGAGTHTKKSGNIIYNYTINYSLTVRGCTQSF